MSIQGKHLIIIGGQRCGTTYLLNLLNDINGFILSNQIYPEPKFFLNNFFDYQIYINQVFGLSNIERDKIYVEKSTSYYEDINSIINIKKNLKNYILVFLIRDPIKRAISNFHFSKLNGYEKLSLNDAFKRELECKPFDNYPDVSKNPQSYLYRSRYSLLIRNVLKHVPKSKIVCLNSEALFKNPLTFFDLINKKDFLPKSLKIFYLMSKKFMKEKINSLDYENNYEQIEESTLLHLKSIFNEEKHELSKLFDLDLSIWEDY